MNILQEFRIGLHQANESKRMIVFAWLVNFGLSLTVAFPMLSLLDHSIGGTVMEERLLERIDTNWFQTFRADNRENPFIPSFDYTMFGYAPFLSHYESVLSGTMIKDVGHFVVDLLFRWQINMEHLGPLTILAFLYLLMSTFLAGAFIGMYAKNFRITFQEFLMEGAKYFGRFFRISLVSLVVYLVLFDMLFDSWSAMIPDITRNEPSEWTPFVHYMIRNAAILLLMAFLTLCFDYAKIRMVVDERVSALIAVWAGMKFAGKNFTATGGLFILLSLAALALMALYALLQGSVGMTGYWSILLVFFLQQVYVGSRLWLKATWYASQTKLYQGIIQTDHRIEPVG